MRHLHIRVPAGQGEHVIALTEQLGATHGASVEARDGASRFDLVSVYVPNQRVGDAIERLKSLPAEGIVVAPQDVLPLGPADGPVPDSTLRVGSISAMEVYIAGLQSIGSWKGLVGYAVGSALLAWVGIFTNSIVLLIGAMLVSPLASPAMTLAIGTARGDGKLIGRSLLRYVAALGLAILVAAAMSWLMRQETATLQMVTTSHISSVAVLLPLLSGAAGAFSQVQSRRDSLVSGAAVGVLVAVSLAPAATLIGMAAVIGEWDMVKSGAFVLAMQLAGINLAGSAVFRMHGLRPYGVGQPRGKASVGLASAGVTFAVLASLLAWQFSSPPQLQHSTRAQRATAVVQQVVQASPLAKMVEADVRFTRANIPGQETLLCEIFVQRSPGVDPEAVRSGLTRAIQSRLSGEGFNVVPLVDVTVLDPPSR